MWALGARVDRLTMALVGVAYFAVNFLAVRVWRDLAETTPIGEFRHAIGRQTR